MRFQRIQFIEECEIPGRGRERFVTNADHDIAVDPSFRVAVVKFRRTGDSVMVPWPSVRWAVPEEKNLPLPDEKPTAGQQAAPAKATK